MADILEYYSVPETQCGDCGESSTYGAYDGEVFFCNDCWDAFEIAKTEKKQKQKKQKEAEKFRKNVQDGRKRMRQALERELQDEEEWRKYREEMTEYFSNIQQVREHLLEDLEQSQETKRIIWALMDINPEKLIPMLVNDIYRPEHIINYTRENLADYFCCLYYLNEASSELGKRVVKAYLSKTHELQPPLPVKFVLPRLPLVEQRDNDKIFQVAESLMVMTDSQFFMQVINDQGNRPFTSIHWYCDLFDHLKEFINPNFMVLGVIKKCKISLSFPEFAITRLFFKRSDPYYFRKSAHLRGTYRRRNLIDLSRMKVQSVLEWCCRSKSDLTNAKVLGLFLDQS